MKTFTKRDNVVIAIVSVIIGIVGLSLYYWYFGNTDYQSLSTTTSPVAGYTTLQNHGTTQTLPKATSTQTLKTYINADLGFSVKYPQNALGLNIPAIFSSVSFSAHGLAYEQCSTQKIPAKTGNFCPIRSTDHGVGMVDVNNEYIIKQGNIYFTVKLTGTYKSAGTCDGLDSATQCLDYGMIQKLFEDQVLPTFTYIK